MFTGKKCPYTYMFSGANFNKRTQYHEGKRTVKQYRIIAKSKILPALHREFPNLDARLYNIN